MPQIPPKRYTTPIPNGPNLPKDFSPNKKNQKWTTFQPNAKKKFIKFSLKFSFKGKKIPKVNTLSTKK